MDATRNETRTGPRPLSVGVVAVVLTLLAVGTALAGLAVTWASACCASSEPADPTFAMVGFVLAGCLLWAGVGLWNGRLARATALALVGTVPVTCVLAAPVSYDLGVLAPFAVAAWLATWCWLRRPGPAGWVGSRRVTG